MYNIYIYICTTSTKCSYSHMITNLYIETNGKREDICTKQLIAMHRTIIISKYMHDVPMQCSCIAFKGCGSLFPRAEFERPSGPHRTRAAQTGK